MKSLTDSLFAVHEVLDGAGVQHALCGGLAANLYREELRATSDVDIAVVADGARVVELVDVFAAAGWKSEPYREQLRLSRASHPRVDCIVATTDYERAAIERAVSARIEGRSIKVLTPEDLVVLKLVAGRARDYEAVAAIINSRGRTLDVAYIKGWLDQFGMPEAWERALAEAKRELG